MEREDSMEEGRRGLEAATAWGRWHHEGGLAVWRGGRVTMACGGGGGNNDVLMVGARSGCGSGGGGGGTDACGGSGDGGAGGWTPSPTFCEQPLEREETPFFSQMMARVCWGGGVLPLL